MHTAVNSTHSAIAELLAQLGRLSAGVSAGAPTLTPAQWSALRYFASANRFSDTVSAFAEYQATTRGTASQTVKTLLRQGYLQQSRRVADGRSRHIALSAKGAEALADDPLNALLGALGTLPDDLGALQRTLYTLVDRVAAARRLRPFGPCRGCAHRGDRCCALKNEPLSDAEQQLRCIDYRPAADGAG